MLIQLDLKKLERHLTSLEEELREVRTLCELMQARRMQADVVPEYMAQQMKYLENQMQWIKNRQEVLNLTLQKFTRIQQENYQRLSEAQRLLRRTDSYGLSEWRKHQ